MQIFTRKEEKRTTSGIFSSFLVKNFSIFIVNTALTFFGIGLNKFSFVFLIA